MNWNKNCNKHQPLRDQLNSPLMWDYFSSMYPWYQDPKFLIYLEHIEYHAVIFLSLHIIFNLFSYKLSLLPQFMERPGQRKSFCLIFEDLAPGELPWGKRSSLREPQLNRSCPKSLPSIQLPKWEKAWRRVFEAHSSWAVSCKQETLVQATEDWHQLHFGLCLEIMASRITLHLYCFPTLLMCRPPHTCLSISLQGSFGSISLPLLCLDAANLLFFPILMALLWPLTLLKGQSGRME